MAARSSHLAESSRVFLQYLHRTHRGDGAPKGDDKRLLHRDGCLVALSPLTPARASVARKPGSRFASVGVISIMKIVDCPIGFSATIEQHLVVASCTTQYSCSAIANAGLQSVGHREKKVSVGWAYAQNRLFLSPYWWDSHSTFQWPSRAQVTTSRA